MSEASRVYRSCRVRRAQIAADLAPDEPGRRVPACPEWKVTELVTHMVGLADHFAPACVAAKDAADVESAIPCHMRAINACRSR